MYAIEKPLGASVPESPHTRILTDRDNSPQGVPARRRFGVGAILGGVKIPTRHAMAVLAVLALAVAGCGGGESEDSGPAGAADDQRDVVVSDFERAVQEAQLLRDDISAARNDIRAAREFASAEAERAASETAKLRGEIAALRLEMQELGAGASSRMDETAQETESLRGEIEAIRSELNALRQAGEETASLSPDEISGNFGYVQAYPEAVLIEAPAQQRRAPYRSTIYSPRAVIHTPYYVQPPLAARPRLVRGGGRVADRAKPRASRGSEGADGKRRSRRTAETPSEQHYTPTAPVVATQSPAPITPGSAEPTVRAPSAFRSRPPSPAVRSSSPPARSSSPQVRSTPPVVRSPSPAVRSAPPVVRSPSPVVRSTPPVVRSPTPVVRSTPPTAPPSSPRPTIPHKTTHTPKPER